MHNVSNKDILNSLNKVTEEGILEFLPQIYKGDFLNNIWIYDIQKRGI